MVAAASRTGSSCASGSPWKTRTSTSDVAALAVLVACAFAAAPPRSARSGAPGAASAGPADMVSMSAALAVRTPVRLRRWDRPADLGWTLRVVLNSPPLEYNVLGPAAGGGR